MSGAADNAPRGPEVISALKFMKNFKPIETSIDGLPMPRGGLVTITAPTGHGKTTVSTLMHLCFCRGLPFAGRDVTRGSVLVLAGENPDDYAMHLAANLQDLGLNGACVSQRSGSLLIVPGTFAIDFGIDSLIKYLESTNIELVAVFVDTSAAFYFGEDENDNTSMRRHASCLRELSTLPGKPTVVVLAHPVKNPQRDNLLPRGGGAFLAEIDANLTLWKDDAGIATLHWSGKIRGPTFDPIRFEFGSVVLDGFKDARGRPISGVVARHLPDERAEQLQARELDDGNRLLLAMTRDPDGSMTKWQLACGFSYKTKVSRLLKEFVAEGLVEHGRGGTYRLLPKGRKEASALP